MTLRPIPIAALIGLTALGIALGCTRSATNESNFVELPSPLDASSPSRLPPTKSTPLAPASGKRCLPVVAAECHCVYDCAVGIETSPGVYSVTHPMWGGTPLVARVAPWCFAGRCTDAFHAEIVCDGICAGKAADSTCHFDEERCVGAGP